MPLVAITPSLLWFLGTLKETLLRIDRVLMKATATRDLAELLEKGCLSKLPGEWR